ncbi:MAG: hypothetical protein JKY70_22500 [Mucilaginibacter sp.]|nr:hypothetical protein [Mucilaginibacter sp.]
MINNDVTSGKSPLQVQLEEEAKLAPLRKLIAESREAEAKADKQATETRKAALDAYRDRWKGPDIKPVDGKITLQGGAVETRILAHVCLSALTRSLVEQFAGDDRLKGNGTKFIIYNAADLPGIQMYQTFKEQLKITGELLEVQTRFSEQAMGRPNTKLVSETPLIAGIAASGILRTAADIFSFFKTSTSITNTELISDESLIVACFESELKKKGLKGKVYYPAVLPPGLTADLAKDSQFIERYTAVASINKAAVSVQGKLTARLAEIDNELMSVTDPGNKQSLETERQKLNEALQPLSAACVLFSQFENTLLTIDPVTKVSVFSALIKFEKLFKLMADEDAFTVKLNAVMNGSSIISEGLFKATSLRHSGGTQLTCLVFDHSGTVHLTFSSSTYIAELSSETIMKEYAHKSGE